MNERDSGTPKLPEFNSIELQFGESIVTLSTHDTIIRRFAEGDGKFDHCLHMTAEGRTFAFTPDERVMTALIVRGFEVRQEDELDERTRNHYADVQTAHLDEELDAFFEVGD